MAGNRVSLYQPLNEAEQAKTPPVSDWGAHEALQALSGHSCHSCGRTPSYGNGFICCDWITCPVCGERGWESCWCSHYVGRINYGVKVLLLGSHEYTHELLGMPHAPHAEQMTRWSEEELAQAYGPELYPLLDTFFGTDRSGCDHRAFNRFKKYLIKHYLSPDICTVRRSDNGKLTRYFFSRDAVPASIKVRQLLFELDCAWLRLHVNSGRLDSWSRESCQAKKYRVQRSVTYNVYTDVAVKDEAQPV